MQEDAANIQTCERKPFRLHFQSTWLGPTEPYGLPAYMYIYPCFYKVFQGFEPIGMAGTGPCTGPSFYEGLKPFKACNVIINLTERGFGKDIFLRSLGRANSQAMLRVKFCRHDISPLLCFSHQNASLSPASSRVNTGKNGEFFFFFPFKILLNRCYRGSFPTA